MTANPQKSVKPKSLLSKRLWRYYLRSAERAIKVFKVIHVLFIGGSTAIILVIVSLFTPIFSKSVLYVLNHLPIPAMTGAAVQSPPSAYVVLGGGLTNDHANQVILNNFTLNRVRTAAAAYRHLPLPVVISGAEAPWMEQWLSEHGVTGIISENASMNTCENARFTAKRIPLHHIYLITDAYHMARARRQFALNNINVTPINAPLPTALNWAEPAQNLSHSRRAVYELAAYFRDVLKPQADCRNLDEVSFDELKTPRDQLVKTF
ncbi:YdcF family protein [Psychrobacter ciconiae]|uniref:YdcF family protein n=1 Tax=Psychrobacter ciconiae TaxID=1553449 RepID=UPI0019188069|nr:YdcF family protein [Psychrobacter ciconiae]